ncbi:hypothetical protein Q8A73_014505 [Channa argus]|nr:hypothetical protein Q8A73_014505 [Channa argus]
MEELQNEITSLRRDKEELTRNNHGLQAQIKELKDVNTELSKVLEWSKIQRKRFLQKEDEVLVDTNKALVLKVTNLQSENEALKSEVQLVQKEMAAEKMSFTQKLQEQENQNKARDETLQEVEAIQCFCEELKCKNRYLKQLYSDLQQAFYEQDRKFQSDNGAIIDERKALQVELQKTTEVLEDLKRKHHTLKQWTDFKTQLIKSQEQKISMLKKYKKQDKKKEKHSRRQAPDLRQIALRQSIKHRYFKVRKCSICFINLNKTLKNQAEALEIPDLEQELESVHDNFTAIEPDDQCLKKEILERGLKEANKKLWYYLPCLIICFMFLCVLVYVGI